ncbi:MAG: hypothetical protein AVDCRST_MAG30-2640, partial [uncultured Solirubrobacteraceae bacterium]
CPSARHTRPPLSRWTSPVSPNGSRRRWRSLGPRQARAPSSSSSPRATARSCAWRPTGSGRAAALASSSPASPTTPRRSTAPPAGARTSRSSARRSSACAVCSTPRRAGCARP